MHFDRPTLFLYDNDNILGICFQSYVSCEALSVASSSLLCPLSLSSPFSLMFSFLSCLFSSPPILSMVQEVHPNSPASQAGLIPQTDYILGSDVLVTGDDLYTLVETHNHQTLKLYVYNAELETCREVGGRGTWVLGL